MKIAVIAAFILLIAAGIVFAQQSPGNGERKPPFNLDENYPRPYGGGGCGGCGGYGGGR